MTLNSGTERANLINEILNKSWDDLRAQEFADYLLFPEELLKLKADGSFKHIPIMLRVPREPEMRKARIKARAWAKDEGLDPDLDPDLFDNMDTMCTLAMAIRNNTEPFEPYEPDPKVLERAYDRPCLDALWAKIEVYRNVLDPRVDNLSEEETLAIIGAIAKSRNIAPLAACSGQSQTTLIVTMAAQFLNSQPPKS